VGSLRSISKAVGNFSVPLQWMLGLRRLKQDASWLEHVPSVLGTQIRPPCCSGVFVDQSAESVVAVELVWRVWTDEM
jgi:hypothetical protein